MPTDSSQQPIEFTITVNGEELKGLQEVFKPVHDFEMQQLWNASSIRSVHKRNLRHTFKRCIEKNKNFFNGNLYLEEKRIRKYLYE